MANTTSSLPSYSGEHLAARSTGELWHLLIRNEDRVPRNLIDECARRGDQTLDQAEGLLEKAYYWDDDDQARGEWWLRLHAVMILGLIPGERAGELLVAYMRRIDASCDDDLQEWLIGYWPAFFRNKPESVVPALHALGEDRSRRWFARVDAVQAAIGHARARGEDPLGEALAWAARMAFSEDDDYDFRLLVANDLLDFALPQYRGRLEALADLQPRLGAVFGRKDIEHAYAAGQEKPAPGRFADPWAFYAPEAIEERQRRWAKEDTALDEGVEDDFGDEPGETYVRPGPKVGRNDPCPCGSGKKYKKCCLE